MQQGRKPKNIIRSKLPPKVTQVLELTNVEHGTVLPRDVRPSEIREKARVILGRSMEHLEQFAVGEVGTPGQQLKAIEISAGLGVGTTPEIMIAGGDAVVKIVTETMKADPPFIIEGRIDDWVQFIKDVLRDA